ncbi:hypothetical protein [Arthrobacter sp. JZ12]|uniref:hypothetical protein n=1 Tax=Arthrobacter sp. JZ12 TaxID=2654190 RepID=UPI002B4879E8|nr:hypothetical protein [Arthrobacter sp. JZ12]
MRKRISHTESPRIYRASRARTGEHCPLDGWWSPDGGQKGEQFIAKGNMMPAENGKPITWKLIAAEQRSRRPKYPLPAPGGFLDNF